MPCLTLNLTQFECGHHEVEPRSPFSFCFRVFIHYLKKYCFILLASCSADTRDIFTVTFLKGALRLEPGLLFVLKSVVCVVNYGCEENLKSFDKLIPIHVCVQLLWFSLLSS